MTTHDTNFTIPAWGKYESPSCFHRLEHHCADVAACFESLIADDVLGSRFARAAGQGAALNPVTSSRLAVIAFLHDFAKLNAGFQFKVRDRKGLPPDPPPKTGHIDEAFYCFHQPEICERIGFGEMVDEWGDGIEVLMLGALSHHGRPPRPAHSGAGPKAIWEPFAGYHPRATATLLRDRVHAWFSNAFLPGPPLPRAPALAHLFAGTVALADQIGSDRENHFPFEPHADPDYIGRARRQAKRAIEARGLYRADWPTKSKPADFKSLFGHAEPRPLQSAVENAPLDRPLLIL